MIICHDVTGNWQQRCQTNPLKRNIVRYNLKHRKYNVANYQNKISRQITFQFIRTALRLRVSSPLARSFFILSRKLRTKGSNKCMASLSGHWVSLYANTKSRFNLVKLLGKTFKTYINASYVAKDISAPTYIWIKKPQRWNAQPPPSSKVCIKYQFTILSWKETDHRKMNLPLYRK